MLCLKKISRGKVKHGSYWNLAAVASNILITCVIVLVFSSLAYNKNAKIRNKIN